MNKTRTWELKLFLDCIATMLFSQAPNVALGRTANESHLQQGNDSISKQLSYNAVLIDPDGALGRTKQEGARVAGSRSLILYIASFLTCSTSVIFCWKTPFSSLFNELFSVREFKLVSEFASQSSLLSCVSSIDSNFE